MANWYEEMAQAVRDREKALSGIERWQAKVHEAEQAIVELSKNQPTIDATVPAATFSGAPAPAVPVAPMASVPAADYSDSAE